MPEPLVSVVMPTFNAERFVSESIASVANQVYTNWELLVTDDGSVDRTPDILERWSRSEPRISYRRLPSNSGAAVARNASIGRASGEFLAFLDADDLWLPEKLRLQVAFMEEHGLDFSFTPYAIMRADGAPSGAVIDSSTASCVGYQDMLLKRATMGCSTVLLRRRIVRELRIPDLRQGQDYAFWLSILRQGVTAQRVSHCLTRYRLVPGSISANKLRKARRQWQIYRELERLSPARAAWCFLNYAVRALVVRAG
jgi:teichuronic acid biosynthesis glycosyltransferase TuaG